jgi:hypothetical protein
MGITIDNLHKIDKEKRKKTQHAVSRINRIHGHQGITAGHQKELYKSFFF